MEADGASGRRYIAAERGFRGSPEGHEEVLRIHHHLEAGGTMGTHGLPRADCAPLYQYMAGSARGTIRQHVVQATVARELRPSSGNDVC